MSDEAFNQMDSLTLIFRAPSNPLTSTPEGLAPFLEAIEHLGGEWAPTLAAGKRRRAYSREAVRKALVEVADDFTGPTLYLDRSSPEASYRVHVSSVPSPERLRILLTILPFSFFEEPPRAEERSRRLIEMVRAWGSAYPASHAIAHSEADLQLVEYPNFGRDKETARKNPYDRVYAVFWLNVLGKELVDSIGRARVLSTPAHLVEELLGGAVLIVTRPTIADFASEEARHAQARALVHLRPDLDLDAVLRDLRARSAALAPVEPRFDPDIAGLLHQVLDHSTISERPRKTAELNAFRSAEVDEWLPAEAAPRSDVADPKKAIAEYETLNTQIEAILHTDVPSVFDHTVEALTDVDHHLWWFNFPELYERYKIDDILIPSAGGYLGCALVERLGGRWVPRQNRDETQVIIGDRAWLPFLRARRYLQSRQSVLACSLTKFFREAERHQRRALGA